VDWVSIVPIQILHGLVYGAVLFLLASGLTLIFGLMDVFEFCSWAFYMLGGLLFFLRGSMDRTILVGLDLCSSGSGFDRCICRAGFS